MRELPDSQAEFRWQALFQRARNPVFVLNRQRRILFVNRAWECLTGLSAVEARGLSCVRRAPAPSDPPDVVVRALCCPPPEVLKGRASRVRRLVPGRKGAACWWDLEFFPLEDEQQLLCVLGKITLAPQGEPALTPPLPDKLLELRDGRCRQYGFDQLASKIPSCHRVVEQIRLACATRVPVLIVGESGTGKQWIARTIHYQGGTREGAFVAFDCAHLPSSFILAWLSGGDRVGRKAEHATYYLREPSRMPRDLQTRFCGLVAEAGENTGSRVIAGSSVDPADEIRSGRLLEQLHYAVSPLVIALPPLRDRLGDFPDLVDRLLSRARVASDSRVTGLTPEAWTVIRAYAWPGNLRELYAVLRSACLHAKRERIDHSDLPAPLCLAVRLEQSPSAAPDKPLPVDQLLEQAERRLIQLALRKAQGNRSRAAELLAIWRPRLLRRMEALGIKEW